MYKLLFRTLSLSPSPTALMLQSTTNGGVVDDGLLLESFQNRIKKITAVVTVENLLYCRYFLQYRYSTKDLPPIHQSIRSKMQFAELYLIREMETWRGLTILTMKLFRLLYVPATWYVVPYLLARRLLVAGMYHYLLPSTCFMVLLYKNTQLLQRTVPI